MICLKPKLILSVFLVGYTGLVLAADMRQNGSNIVIVPGAGVGSVSHGQAAPGDSPDQRRPIRVSRSHGHLSGMHSSQGSSRQSASGQDDQSDQSVRVQFVVVSAIPETEVTRVDLSSAQTIEEKVALIAIQIGGLEDVARQKITALEQRVAALENKQSCMSRFVKCLCCMK